MLLPMRTRIVLFVALSACVLLVACAPREGGEESMLQNSMDAPVTVNLSSPSLSGARSLEEVLASRRSVREFMDVELAEVELSQLLWSAQGITDSSGKRTAPSAGALYPLEVYVALPRGFYHYNPEPHTLSLHVPGDQREVIHTASFEQDSILSASAVLVFTAVFERTTRKYGERASNYVYVEAGHAAQNLLLQATSLGLGGVPVGAFDGTRLQEALTLPEDHVPVYVVPVGRPR
jgi:SagB-type dehydrogenase family enzyme